MRPIENWWLVLKHAWSVRLMALGLVLNAGAIVLPLLAAAVPASLMIGYGLVTFGVIVAAGASRFIKQDKLGGGTDGEPG